MPVPGGTAARKLVTAADCSGGRPSRLPAQASTGESLPGGHQAPAPSGHIVVSRAVTWRGDPCAPRDAAASLAAAGCHIGKLGRDGGGGSGRTGVQQGGGRAGGGGESTTGGLGGPALHSPLCWDRGGRLYSGQSSETHLLQALMQWAACPTVQAMQQPSLISRGARLAWAARAAHAAPWAAWPLSLRCSPAGTVVGRPPATCRPSSLCTQLGHRAAALVSPPPRQQRCRSCCCCYNHAHDPALPARLRGGSLSRRPCCCRRPGHPLPATVAPLPPHPPACAVPGPPLQTRRVRS
jgi:hypothetical protein